MAWYSNLVWLLAQAQPAADAVPVDEGMTPVVKLLIAVGLIAGSMILGNIIARAVRMPDYAFKIALVIFTFAASVVICWVGWPPKRGIDLSGGVALVYEVDRSLSEGSWMPGAIEQLNTALNSGGGERLEATPTGADKIEITVPEGVDGARVERALSTVRSPDLSLKVDKKRTEGSKTVYVIAADQQQKAVDMNKLIAAVGRRINPGGVKELTIRQYGAEQLEVIIPEINEAEVEQIKKRISTGGLLEFRIVANETDDKEIIRASQRTPGRDVYVGGKLLGRWVQAGPDLDIYGSTTRVGPAGIREILVRMDPYDVDGRYLTRAMSGVDQNLSLSVNFAFDSVGAKKFGDLTSRNLPESANGFHRRLGIVLDNVMLSAPNINSTITDSGQITGNFNQAEVDFLVSVLNAGSLPATLRPEPISQERISAQLGTDTIRMGTMSMVISTGAVLIFMLIYYRFCGLIADIAVMLNVLVTVALMILIKAAFTLPGLAGLVLTVGMAVDANVLIYERMREELGRGASLRMAIRNGFSRAMATIIDSHLTTLSTGVVLYIIGTDQIKGFAVTLIIGLLMSLYTAVFVSRVIIDIAEKRRWFTQAKMMHIIGHTDIDFIRWRGPAIAVSVAICAIGLFCAARRGSELLDIDFTGGSSVQVVFEQGKEHDIAEVRKAVEGLPDVAVSSVGEGTKILAFKIDTSEHDITKVKQTLTDVFGDSLLTYKMTFDRPVLITQANVDTSTTPKVESPTLEFQMPSKQSDNPANVPEVQATPTETPAETKPAETKPAETKAEETKPADNPPTEMPAKPADEEPAKDNVNLNPRNASLAMLLVAQAPTEETKQGEQEKAATADSAVKMEAPPATTAPATTASPTTPANEGPVSMVGGSRATLNFPQEISYGPLHELVQQGLAEKNLGSTHFELKNPKYQPGSDLRFNDWTLEILLEPAQAEQVLQAIQAKVASTPVFPMSSQIGGKVAGDTQLMAVYALLASMLIIVVYIWVRFQNIIFGIAAIVALVHDVLVTIAFLGMSYYLSPYLGALLVDPFKISLAVVAALLTIVGFSINDTIVVFDRIREIRGKRTDLTPQMINDAVNQTLSRTILTSGTVFIATFILYVMGGPGIHAFAYAMLIGVIAGTYSSIYIAAPVLLWMKKPAPAKAASGAPTGKQVPSG